MYEGGKGGHNVDLSPSAPAAPRRPSRMTGCLSAPPPPRAAAFTGVDVRPWRSIWQRREQRREIPCNTHLSWSWKKLTPGYFGRSKKDGELCYLHLSPFAPLSTLVSVSAHSFQLTLERATDLPFQGVRISHSVNRQSVPLL